MFHQFVLISLEGGYTLKSIHPRTSAIALRMNLGIWFIYLDKTTKLPVIMSAIKKKNRCTVILLGHSQSCHNWDSPGPLQISAGKCYFGRLQEILFLLILLADYKNSVRDWPYSYVKLCSAMVVVRDLVGFLHFLV